MSTCGFLTLGLRADRCRSSEHGARHRFFAVKIALGYPSSPDVAEVLQRGRNDPAQ